jgi:hypothetical protein
MDTAIPLQLQSTPLLQTDSDGRWRARCGTFALSKVISVRMGTKRGATASHFTCPQGWCDGNQV